MEVNKIGIGAKTCILFVQCQWPLMAHANKTVKRVGNPERPSLDLCVYPVLGLTNRVLCCNLFRRIDFIESHELDEAETAPRADPASSMIGPQKFVDKYKDSRLHVLDVGKTGVAVLVL